MWRAYKLLFFLPGRPAAAATIIIQMIFLFSSKNSKAQLIQETSPTAYNSLNTNKYQTAAIAETSGVCKLHSICDNFNIYEFRVHNGNACCSAGDKCQSRSLIKPLLFSDLSATPPSISFSTTPSLCRAGSRARYRPASSLEWR